MSEFKIEDLDEVIKNPGSSLVQLLALQLKNTMMKLDESTLECDVIRDQITFHSDKCRALAAENVALKDAVDNCNGCFDAAEAEGLGEALAESKDDRLVDLVQRRLIYAVRHVETPATDAIINALRAEGVVEHITHLHGAFDVRIAIRDPHGKLHWHGANNHDRVNKDSPS